MQLGLGEDQELLTSSFDELFAAESSGERIRAAEQVGFDPALWRTLGEAGALSLRVGAAQGGGGASLFDACLVADRAGRHLATGPVPAAIVAARVLAEAGSDPELLDAAVAGRELLAFVPKAVPIETDRWLVEGGAHAAAAVVLIGDSLLLARRPDGAVPAQDLGRGGFAWWSPADEAVVLATGLDAHRTFEAAVAEWRLLTAAALVGLARRAVEMAAEYAGERVQFDRRIGEFQGIAHPLANAITEIEGARLAVWNAVWQAGFGSSTAAAAFSMAFVWAAEVAVRATGTALHTFGGYGLALEYDLQLYQRRAKAWAVSGGDPADALVDVADGLWGDRPSSLPAVGDVPIDFELGSAAEEFRSEVRVFLAEYPPAEYGCEVRPGWDGHDPEWHAALARAGLGFASWSEEHGGQNRNPYEMTALMEELYEAGVSLHPLVNARMVGETLMRFAQPELLDEVIPALTRGEALLCLGYSEPESGSDVAAAQTRAERDGDQWVINGQKMFTSGADISQYVFLLTRTDPEAPKHRGLTMFLVPLDTPGIEIQPIHTLSDEKTNATFYNDVRIPDRYRVGEVNGGMAAIGYALEIEHGGGGVGLFARAHADALAAAVAWAGSAVRGAGLAIDDPIVRTRLARVATRAHVSSLFNRQSLWRGVEKRPNRAEGPMSKLFSAEAYIADSAELVDLAAPESLLMEDAAGSLSNGELEFGYRLSAATSIYGGSSEIMRSIIAEVALGMPRSRS